jgi:ribonuclease HI
LSIAEEALLEIYIDGACIPANPGGTPVWGCFFVRDKEPVDMMGGLAGARSSAKATNSVAEYAAFVNALAEAKRRGWENDRVTTYTDSQFLHWQLEIGKKVKTPHLLTFNKKALLLKEQFRSVRTVLILRERNKIAHKAARMAYLESKLGRV